MKKARSQLDIVVSNRVIYAFRAQMDALWPLQPRMRLFGFGMCLGFLSLLNLHEKKVQCHLLITAYVEDQEKQLRL